MRKLLWTGLLLAFVAPLHAQVAIGADYDAEVFLHRIGSGGDVLERTFRDPARVAAPQLALRSWYAPAARGSAWQHTWFASYLSRDAALTTAGWRHVASLDDDPMAGAPFWYFIVSDWRERQGLACAAGPACEHPRGWGEYTRRTIASGHGYDGPDGPDRPGGFDGPDRDGDVFEESPDLGVVPEPFTMLLLGTGLAGVAAAKRRGRGRGRGRGREELE